MTLLAPTSNPVRRQWAAIIANSYQAANIDARLVYVSFGTLINTILGANAFKLYDQGGYDAGFVGFGGGTVLPDYGTQNVIAYRNEQAGDVPPAGSNYYFYKNATFNSLSDQYAASFDPVARAAIAQQMVRIVGQDRPDMVLIQVANVYAWAANAFPWNVQNAETSNDVGVDFQHWKLTGGATTINVAETGDVASVDPVPTGATNSFYGRFLFGQPFALLEELDPRTGNYYKAAATSITSSADHLTWTVSFAPHTWHDGVSVTSDDYNFANLATLKSDVSYTGLGTNQGLFGLYSTFTWLNGTTTYVSNGTYFKTKPTGFTPTSSFTSVNPTTFKFTMPSAYTFTDPILTGGSAMPMHIMEKIPGSAWANSFPGALQTTPTKVTWSKAQYGGNGSFAWAFGPVGDGAYIYKGYDTVAGVGTMVANPNYWNASGLQAIGEFSAKTVHIVHIAGKDAAIAAFKNGQVNFMDSNYQFNHDDITTITGIGGLTNISVDPSAGWQEMGLNNNSPIWGTGTGTPLGQQNPSQATSAARIVRHALSLLIPRQYILTNLLQGIGQVGITQFCTCFAWAYPSDVKADPYDPATAKSLLASVGYSVAGLGSSGGGITLPVAPTLPPISVNGTNVAVNVVVPNFLLGSSFTLSGVFKVDPVLSFNSNGFAVVLQQSTDAGTTWTPVAFAFTPAGSGAYTLTFTPTVSGSVQYRVLFTGIPVKTVQNAGFNNATFIQAQLAKDFGGIAPSKGRALNTTSPAYGTVSTLQVGSLGDVINAVVQAQAAVSSAQTNNVQGVVNKINSALNSLTGSINSLSSATQSSLNTISTKETTDVGNVSSQLSTLTNVSYAALAVAVVLGLLAIGLSTRKRS